MTNGSLDLFFQACETKTPIYLGVGLTPRYRKLVSPSAVVGSDPRCDVVLKDPSVCPRHCYLQAIGTRVLCIDLGTDRKIDSGEGPTSACWLDRNHSLKVGGQTLSLGAEGGRRHPLAGLTANDRVAEVPLLTRPLPRVALEFQANNLKTRWRMRRAVALVGSAPDCAVRLNGPAVSRYHCALILTGLGLWVVDLLGHIDSPTEGGVVVNGSRPRIGRLSPGDVLGIGRFQITPRVLSGPSSRTVRLDRARGVSTEAHGSGEIAVLSDPPLETVSPSSATTPTTDMEALRREYEDRFDRQARLHRAEVGSLRDEIENLRERLEEIRSSDLATSRQVLPRRDRNPVTAAHQAEQPSECPFRTLGVATRLTRTDPRTLANALPGFETGSQSLTFGSIGVDDRVPLAPPFGPTVPWSPFDNPLTPTTQDVRHAT
jgi:pSer/pThr/pTyr-binding forkhead associated (FHA) protein